MMNLILLISVIIGTVVGELIPKSCDQCVPVLECPAAMKWIDTTNAETTKTLRQAYCGKSDRTFLICCSDFQTTQEQEHPNLKLLPSFCGTSYYSGSFGGLGITLYELPWMALISYRTRDGLQFQCTGTIINLHYILTAASCVVDKTIAGVRIGEYNIEQEYDCVGDVCENSIQDKRVEEKIVHPNYEGAPKYENDIALLRVQKLDFSFKNAGPICLPRTKEMMSESIEGRLATIAGWGFNKNNEDVSIVRKAAIPVLSEKVCQNYYRDVIDENSTRFCAGSNNTDTCVSDIGGPLMINTGDEPNQKVFQYGIMSRSPVACGPESPGIFTDVRQYVTWILDNIKE